MQHPELYIGDAWHVDMHCHISCLLELVTVRVHGVYSCMGKGGFLANESFMDPLVCLDWPLHYIISFITWSF